MAKNWIYTDLSAKDALVLEIAGVAYEVTQYSASFACNEIPVAVCAVALGRNARTQKAAAIHGAQPHRQMQPAVVWFHPRAEYSLANKWPAGRRKIFEGYFTGFAFRKINNKVTAVARLLHWSAALGFSSCVTKNGHVSNPASMNAAAVLASLNDANASPGYYISRLPITNIVVADLASDFWQSLKTVFCALSNIETISTGPNNECTGGGETPAKNDVAQAALARIEGPNKISTPDLKGCDAAYKWGVPLVFDVNKNDLIIKKIADTIGNKTIASYASTSFWDKLITEFCPAFSLAFIPRVDRGLVIADTPSLADVYWREISATEQDSFDMDPDLPRPLRAVGVLVTPEMQTMYQGEAGNPIAPLVGGCYVEQSVAPNDGAILYVEAPEWLASIPIVGDVAGKTSNIDANGPSRTSTTPAATSPRPTQAPSAIGNDLNAMYARWAQTIYVMNALRGRNGAFSGKLRFDIAPGSIVRIRGKPERFIGAEDALSGFIHGCVSRVTIAINAEAGMAGTSFALSHCRYGDEISLPRTSTKQHPLFGTSIHGNGKHGCPLVDDYAFEE